MNQELETGASHKSINAGECRSTYRMGTFVDISGKKISHSLSNMLFWLLGKAFCSLITKILENGWSV